MSSDKILTRKDIDANIVSKITTQDYSKRPSIEGVQIIDLKNFVNEDGYFLELARLGKNAKILELPFNLTQISYSNVSPGVVKGWHLHFKQDDLWFVPPEHKILVGLCDLRKNSKTSGVSMRFVFGAFKSQLLFIPRGVAHGYANISSVPATLLYFANQYFNLNKPDEYRLKWDYFGKDFWEVKKG